MRYFVGIGEQSVTADVARPFNVASGQAPDVMSRWKSSWRSA